MATEQQEETVLEAQIQTYRDQLAVVREKVENGAGEDLKQLLTDLEQLIDLSEENLMEVKKHRLLLMIQHPPTSSSDTQPVQREALHRPHLPSGGEGLEGVAVYSDTTPSEELIGKKCQAPLEESWGGENHHNAVILCEEPGPPDLELSDAASSEPSAPAVRVLFLQPLYAAMKPCPFFLESTCRYSQQECKFSHGHVLPLSKLRPYVEPDYSLAHIGGRCLAKAGDGLWYPGVISSPGEECVVHFPSLSCTLTLPQEDMMPLESSSSSEDEEEEEEEGRGGEESEGEDVVVEWRPSGPHAAMGQWERHTTGIGSKLLAKMGYVLGQGLGKESQGRVEPVEIVILPAGKSLDVCAKLREENKVKTVDGLERKRRKRKGKVVPVVAEEKPADMFEFLNTQVFVRDKKSDSNFLKKSNSVPAKKENLNVQLFRVQEDIKSVNKRKKSLKDSLSRHEKRKEKQLAEQTREKLSAVEAQLLQLHRQEQTLQRNINTKTEQKKLAIF